MAGGLLLGWLGWVYWLSAAVLGFAVGSAALAASGRHRDAAIQAVAGGAALIGILLAVVVMSVGRAGGGPDEIGRAIMAISYQEFMLPVFLALAGAIARFLL